MQEVNPSKRWKPGGKYCSAFGCNSCSNRDGKQGVKFFRFPKDPVKRQEWIAQVDRTEPNGSAWTPANNARVCSKHFVSGKSSNDPENTDYIPTIFPISSGPEKYVSWDTKPKKRRHDRSQVQEVAQRRACEEEEQCEVAQDDPLNVVGEDCSGSGETSSTLKNGQLVSENDFKDGPADYCSQVLAHQEGGPDVEEGHSIDIDDNSPALQISYPWSQVCEIKLDLFGIHVNRHFNYSIQLTWRVPQHLYPAAQSLKWMRHWPCWNPCPSHHSCDVTTSSSQDRNLTSLYLMSHT